MLVTQTPVADDISRCIVICLKLVFSLLQTIHPNEIPLSVQPMHSNYNNKIIIILCIMIINHHLNKVKMVFMWAMLQPIFKLYGKPT